MTHRVWRWRKLRLQAPRMWHCVLWLVVQDFFFGGGGSGILIPSFYQADGYRRFGTKHEYPLCWKLQTDVKCWVRRQRYSFPVHAMEAYGGSRGIAQSLYNVQDIEHCWLNLHQQKECGELWWVTHKYCNSYLLNWATVDFKYVPFFPPLALRPNKSHGLLILEVSRSHTPTYHSR